MSGGSFNYLFSASLNEKKHNVDEMLTEITKLSTRATMQAAIDTALVLVHMREIERLQDKLREVWYTVEWYISNDKSESDAKAAIMEYKEKCDGSES